ncbi:MAG TPA: hypothetical protein QF821_01905 [Candidatus Thalassarchaeaceae archaeon]|nr:hypothetical protein [Candidatus Thalassarchaeaceae archaeon]
MGTGSELPFFESQEEGEIEITFTGKATSLYFEETESPSNNGWAVYMFGQYLDDDGDGLWDDCVNLPISFSNETEEGFYYPSCSNSTQREEVEGMIYVGQLCFNPSNSTSQRCNEGNYTLDSGVIVRLSQEFEQNDDKSLFSRIIDWFLTGLATGRTILCGSLLLLFLGGLLALILPNEEEDFSTKKRDGPTAEWRAYSLTGQERGDDGLPKAFTRHSEKKDIFRKPRKGNVIGGVHKKGGLYLEGWTDADSDAAYKKKVEDRRKNR